MYHDHRHLREIDCTLAIVGGSAADAESGGKSIHWPRMWCQKCFIAAAAAGYITTTVNKGRWAGPMSSLLLLDVYDHESSLSKGHSLHLPNSSHAEILRRELSVVKSILLITLN